jgi:hypothetical protein
MTYLIIGMFVLKCKLAPHKCNYIIIPVVIVSIILTQKKKYFVKFQRSINDLIINQ